jgi:hypothetical protein
MHKPIQNAIFDACREFMKPIVRLLLKNGVGYREFSEICKELFVQVASDDHGLRGRKTNMSRVAVMTGLSRKEVRKIREKIGTGGSEAVLRPSRPESVLSIWHTSSDFLDQKHKPRRIRFDGAGATFCELVSRAGGDIPPRAMLVELLRSGAVIEEGEKLRVVSRSFVPEPDDPQAIFLAGGAIRDLASTIYHNLSCENLEERFFERHVVSDRLPREQRSRFRKLAHDRGQLLLEDLNAWLSDRELSRAVSESERALEGSSRIGVGVYFFDSMGSLPKSKDLDKSE